MGPTATEPANRISKTSAFFMGSPDLGHAIGSKTALRFGPQRNGPDCGLGRSPRLDPDIAGQNLQFALARRIQNAVRRQPRGFALSPDGRLTRALTWPAGLPPGFEISFQAVILDPAGPFGFAASNALVGISE